MRIYAFVGSFCVLAALAAAPASAADSKPHKEKKVCHRELMTGSINPSMTCHTREEWKRIAQERERNTDNIMDRTRAGSTRGESAIRGQ